MIEAFLGLLFVIWLITLMFRREEALPKAQQLHLREGSNNEIESYGCSLRLVLGLLLFAGSIMVLILVGAGGQ